MSLCDDRINAVLDEISQGSEFPEIGKKFILAHGHESVIVTYSRIDLGGETAKGPELTTKWGV